MRIKLTDNASSNYVRRCYNGAPASCGMLHRPDFAAMLKAVQGQWLEVETAYLFADQFNTAPIPGVSELGLRVMASEVAEIEGDVRPGVIHDGWTNRHYFNREEIPAECLTPERAQYLKVFTPSPGDARGVVMFKKKFSV
jgi:hypothetical protein